MSESSLQLNLTAPNGRQIPLKRGLFIDNKFVSSTGGESLRPIDPTTEAKICQVDAANADDIDRAVKAAQRALNNPTWRDISGTERGGLMNRLADLMEQNQEVLATLESWNTGKPYTSVLNLELPAAIGCIRYYAGWADKLHGQTILTHSKKFAYTVKQPIGVCGQIIPWNYPVLMAAWKLGPALVTGNTIVLKPAEQTPLSMPFVADLIISARFPPGVVNVINGYGRTAGHALVSHPSVAKIAFTGSTITGRLIQQTAGATLKKVTLETGGKSPLLVFNDADIEQAAKWAHCGIMSNQGQICIANSRLLAQKIGNPFDEDTFQGPQISKTHLEKILSYVKGAVEEGATLETGGETWGEKGFFMQPTVFSDVSSSMKIYREEIFGPAVAISPFGEEEEAVTMANDSEFGLAASVFTGSIQRSHRVSTRLDAGMVWVNSSTDSDFRVPFGGMKQSGVGRELGEAVHVNVGLEL
ncbi:hypothetical protein CEP54_012547 [Fusarium duplospermum]|uniref:aldehyde dehydrogenase (NAD(+)) n=1 Tax=Fusarium duplospermum TaxID=1325734 RepID=A0A428P7X7_9HYPO|nr:hypothetical protein CEP54_012547 [Fusarium duplospermum]